jgi:hypothetical protein
MKKQRKDDLVYNRLKSVFTNYALMNWNDVNSRLKVLHDFIQQTEYLDVDISQLNDYIINTKHQLKYPLEITKSKAVMITKDKNIRIYKFGSDTCPECKSYKNYLRICPHCEHFEITN